ncbi:hypothetical protein ACVW0P_003257 [Mucilaginibacter sp. UYNi724]
MKKSTYHIFCAWALMLCFITGQYMVFAHQHNIIKTLHAKNCTDCHNTSKQDIKEKCQLCDSMHHTYMELPGNNQYASFTPSNHTFITFEYDFKSIALVLSQGRAPPVVS